MTRTRNPLRLLLHHWPGRRRYGQHAFLPVFFLAGALLELLMNKWTVGRTNFYVVVKEKQVERLAQEAVDRELLRRSLTLSSGDCSP